MGFTFDDTGAKGIATPIADMKRISWLKDLRRQADRLC
jgi:hypothetical protein